MVGGALGGDDPKRRGWRRDWIGPRMHPFNAYDVGMVIQRLRRLCADPAPQEVGDPRPVEVRWSEIAAWSRKTIHPRSPVPHAIAEPAPGDELAPWPWNYEPRNGVSTGQIRGLAGCFTAYPTTTRTNAGSVCGRARLSPTQAGSSRLIAIATQGLKPLQGFAFAPPATIAETQGTAHIGQARDPEPRALLPPVQRLAIPDAAGWEDGPNLGGRGRAWCVRD